MQITSYNFHLGLLRSELCRVNTEQSTRAVVRPASLRHQSGTFDMFCYAVRQSMEPRLGMTFRVCLIASVATFVSCNTESPKSEPSSRIHLASDPTMSPTFDPY